MLPSNVELRAGAMFISIARQRPSHSGAGFRAQHRQIGIVRLMPIVIATMRRWAVRSQQRHALRKIAERNDDHLLKDMGFFREEAFREANKPFWQR